MIEDDVPADDLHDGQPVRELHDVSHDPSLQHLITLADGRTITALELQGEYLDRARKFVDDRLGDDADEQTEDVLARWESVLAALAMTRCSWPTSSTGSAKLRLLKGYRDRDGLDWDCAAAAAGRPAVLRRPPGEGPVPPAGRARRDEDAAAPRARPSRR